jgi:hypothetical protein
MATCDDMPLDLIADKLGVAKQRCGAPSGK